MGRWALNLLDSPIIQISIQTSASRPSAKLKHIWKIGLLSALSPRTAETKDEDPVSNTIWHTYLIISLTFFETLHRKNNTPVRQVSLFRDKVHEYMIGQWKSLTVISIS